MTKQVFKNYDAFLNMVLSTTLMSNAQTDEFLSDAKEIIDFIGKAYCLPTDFIDECKDFILDELITLGLITDQSAVYSSRRFGDEYSETDVLFDIKGDVLSMLQNLRNIEGGEINPGWFDYSHYKTYQADVRYAKINKASASGDLITTRQAGILRALGIGCEKNFTLAKKRLSQCVFWGDVPAMHFLAYVYKLEGNDSRSNLFCELAELSKKYLLAGYTVLPEDAKETYSEEARTYYVYISSIKQDVVYGCNRKNIDFSFVEAITSDSLDYFERMHFINNYENKAWKDVTNSSEKPMNALGFK